MYKYTCVFTIRWFYLPNLTLAEKLSVEFSKSHWSHFTWHHFCILGTKCLVWWNRRNNTKLTFLVATCFPGRQAVTSFHKTNLRAIAVHSLCADPNWEFNNFSSQPGEKLCTVNMLTKKMYFNFNSNYFQV